MSNDCSQHKKDIAGISDMKQLAEMIGDLHYETLSQLLFELQTKLHEDSMNDLKNNRFKLSHHLRRASTYLYEASNDIESAWQISKKFMKIND
jgi:hypothetical protein